MAEPSQDSRSGAASDFRRPVLDGLELGLELAVAGRLVAGPLRRLPLRSGARLAGGTLRAASRGAAAAALIEAPVALIEETLAVRRGHKTPEQAALAPVAPALLLAGGATVVISTGLRLREAFAAPPPPALAPEPPPEFIEMRQGVVVQGTEIWYAPPAGSSDSGSDQGEWAQRPEW